MSGRLVVVIVVLILGGVGAGLFYAQPWNARPDAAEVVASGLRSDPGEPSAAVSDDAVTAGEIETASIAASSESVAESSDGESVSAGQGSPIDPATGDLAAPKTPSSADAQRSGAQVAKPERPNNADALQAAGAALKETGAQLAGAEALANQQPRPSFDLVRVDPDGSTVLAGRAQPGADVRVTVDGEVIAETKADRRGEFVALFDAFDASSRRSDQDSGLVIGLSAQIGDAAPTAAAAPIVVALPDRADERPIAVRPTTTGADLLQPSPPATEGAVSIDAVTYDDEGAVKIAGRGAPGQVARVYLDDGLATETLVNVDGEWRAELDRDVPPEVYRLRVDQIDDEGDVSSRAETPFERASIEDVVLQEGGVIVQPGNNLWRIASHVYGDGLKYHLIFDSNQGQIRDPDLIYPGQIFELPQPLDRDQIQSN